MHDYDSIIPAINRNLRKRYAGVKPAGDPPLSMNFEEKGPYQYERLNKYIHLGKNMTILDLGCGYGQFVLECHQRGVTAYGYEADPECVRLAKKALEIAGINPSFIKQSTGSLIPFDDCQFDVIHAAGVLEFILDIAGLIREMIRVLKPRGQIFTTDYNSNVYWDSHYNLLLIPWMPKQINKAYLRIRGRPNVDFLDILSFISPRKFEKIATSSGLEIINIGKREWKENIDKMDSYGRSSAYMKVMRAASILGLKKVLKTMADLYFYTPMRYVMKKVD